MADFRSALRQRLLADPGKPAAVQFVEFVRRPEANANGSGLPGVTLAVIADPRPAHFTGSQGLRETRISADCWSALDSLEAIEIAEWLRGVLETPDTVAGVRFERSFIEGPGDSGEQLEALYVYRARLDCQVWHALA